MFNRIQALTRLIKGVSSRRRRHRESRCWRRRRVWNGDGFFHPQPTRGYGESSSSHKRFCCFLSASKRLSRRRLFAIQRLAIGRFFDRKGEKMGRLLTLRQVLSLRYLCTYFFGHEGIRSNPLKTKLKTHWLQLSTSSDIRPAIRLSFREGNRSWRCRGECGEGVSSADKFEFIFLLQFHALLTNF